MKTAQKIILIHSIFTTLYSSIMAVSIRPETLRVMSFNIWMSGSQVDDGLKKIAKHIRLVAPDIVALQEVDTPLILRNLTESLGEGWSAHFGSGVYSDVGILTKHKVGYGVT